MDHYKNLRFTYGNTNQPHTLTAIGNGLRETTTFQWDANGNMLTRQDNRHNPNIWHCWDEDNRLTGVRNAQMAGYYQYDAQGERIYKLTAEVQTMQVNGHTMVSAANPREILYASPYLVADRNGYTKHYFAGTERIASKTGTGGLADISQPVCTSQQLALKREHSNMLADDVFIGCLHMEHVVLNDWQLKILHNLSVAQGPEQECYWYHSDHIGSTAWVSGVTGTGIAHRGYLPFGEPFVTQQLPGAWNPRYTFSGKERDEETGYSYFGARYYHSDLSIWLSVDPMSDKYPSLSPYAYCGNNPIQIMDPNGEDIWEINSHGRVVNHIEDQTIDAFYLVDKKGNRLAGKEVSFNYGTIESFKSQYSDDYNTTFDWYNVRGDDNGKKLFEFFANNTKVEFSHLMLGVKGDEGLNIISTSHETSKEHSVNFLLDNKYQYGYTIRGHNHSHPNNTQYPSGLENRDKDIAFAKKLTNISLKNGSSIPTFQIYIPKTGKYIKYNKNSTHSQFPAYPIEKLTGITCRPE